MARKKKDKDPDIPQPEFSFAEGQHEAPDPTTELVLFATPDSIARLDHPDRAEDSPSGHHRLHPSPLKRLMDYNFLEYASYVICDRAIPNLADGLKPVHRRILHSLHERDDGRFIKVANVVGHCMQYHPHGDASIADALVTITNKRYLIEGQGNFGNIFTGDRAAASRYIECRLTELARKEVFNKQLTRYVPSYDGRNQEPVTLPAKLPLLLMLGADGIAVGLSTRILPHNFRELIEAQIAILQKKKFEVYPDFQQGRLMDVSEYDLGRGKVKVRAVIEKDDKHKRLVIRELPFGTTTESLIGSVEDAVRKRKVPVRTINDFTAGTVEIELILSPGTDPQKAIKKLFAFTSCENSVSSNLVLIRDGRPVEMTVDEVLRANTAALKELLRLELELNKQKLLDEFHSKTLVQIFVENRLYKKIEECETYPGVQQAVFDGLAPFRDRLKRDVTIEDVEMLLGIRIKRISLFDINKNRKDIEGILAELARVEKNLKALTRYTVSYLKGLLKTYGDDYPRLTKITTFEEIELRKLTANELEILHDDEGGYIGHAVKGKPLMQCSSLDKLLIVWDNGTYKVIQPQDKFFVDKNMVYGGRYQREQVFTAIYTEDHFTYMKRFKIGGAILNREYEYAPRDSKVWLIAEGTPEDVYVKYRPAKNQRIHQQIFHPGEVAVKGLKARGNQMTGKAVARLTARKPGWWDGDNDSPRGVLL